jgi:hypothetical protein
MGKQSLFAVKFVYYEEREVGGSERDYRGWEGKEFNIGFEGSQALPIYPFGKCKAFNRYY